MRSVSSRCMRASASRRPSPSSSAAAAPNPTIAGTSSSPPRRARSCAPPTTNGGNRRPRRTSSAPAPFGPPNLCALTEQRSGPRASKSTGMCPAAMHASTCTSTPRSRQAAATSAAGWTVPTSWLASWTVTRAVFARTAPSTSAGSQRPRPSTPTTVTSAPLRLHASSTAECSTAVVTRCADSSARATAPHTAVLIASVPLAVNTTSRGRAPRSVATCSRAPSSATRVALPSEWSRPGSAWCSRRYGTIASNASGRSGDVDAWSRYARRTTAASDRGDAVIVAGRAALGEQRARLPVQAGEHPADHAPVDRAHDVRVLLGRVAERALLGDDLERAAARLRVGGEAVGRERIGDGRQRGPHRPVAGADVTGLGGHAGGDGQAVVVPDLLGHGGGFVGVEHLQRPRQQRGEEVVAPGREVQRRVELPGPVPLRRAAGGLVSGQLDRQVAARGQLLEVMTGDVGMEIEALGNLGGGDAVTT